MIEPEITRRLSQRMINECCRIEQWEFRSTMGIIFLVLVASNAPLSCRWVPSISVAS